MPLVVREKNAHDPTNPSPRSLGTQTGGVIGEQDNRQLKLEIKIAARSLVNLSKLETQPHLKSRKAKKNRRSLKKEIPIGSTGK